MEGSPESVIYLEILGITRFPTEEEDVRARWMSVESNEGTHQVWVYYQMIGEGNRAKTRLIIKKTVAKGRIRTTPGIKVFEK